MALKHFIGYTIGLAMLGGLVVRLLLFAARALAEMFCRRVMIAGKQGSYQTVAVEDTVEDESDDEQLAESYQP